MTEKYKLKKGKEDFGDWETLYKDIFESALVINLNEFFAKQNNEIEVNVICIYGDVVQLSNNLEIQNLKCCGIILIAARPTNIGGLISLHSGEFMDISIFDITRSILTWIVKISEQLKDREEKEFEMVKKLYHHASRMLEQLNAFIEREESEFTLVPQFDMETYEEHFNCLMKFAEDYEKQYKDILKQEHIDKQKIENLKNKLLDHKDMTEVHKYLEEVENKQFELSQNVRKEIGRKLQPGSVLNFVDTIKKVSESVQNVLMTMDIKRIKDLANITKDENVKHDLELAKDLNSKTEEIKKITNELKASRNKADELHNSTEKMNKELESFGPENLKN
ncbi:1302_t:CDS:2, partial [Gigaspora rosea]